MRTFFDFDFAVGGSGAGLRTPQTPAEALAIMDRYAIARALVYDRAAMEAGIFDRMDWISSFCAGSDGRLVPAIPLAPPATGECPPPDELPGLMAEKGIKAVRIWPEQHALDLDPFAFGPAFEVLQKHRIPVLVCMSEAHHWQRRPGWRDVQDTARAFPQLPLVVLWSGMRDGRRLFPLLEACPNVRADLTCVTYQFIEYAVEQWSSGQLVTATHYPLHDPGLYLPWVNYAGIPAEAKDDLAWRNATDLIEGILP